MTDKIPLVDGDVLTYELGFSSQEVDEDTGEVIPRSWDFTRDLIERRIDTIKQGIETDADPVIYLTTNPFLQKELNKLRRWNGEEEKDWSPVFREVVAKTKPYKGGRKLEKPYHYKNILSHFLHTWKAKVSEDGLEADDLMCLDQVNAAPNSTIICSRDKDLRMCPGWHYSWECGNQPSVGPIKADELGFIRKIETIKEKEDGTTKKIVKWFGVGGKFFLFQMIAGDNVDNIPGLPKKGPVFAYNMLEDVSSFEEGLEKCKKAYKEALGKEWKEYWNEMHQLLWMVREIKDGEFVFPYLEEL